MNAPESILLGLELSADGRWVAPALGQPAELAYLHATQLAQRCHAKLLLMSVLPEGADQWDADTQMLLEERHGRTTVWDTAVTRLAELADRARDAGVTNVDTLVVSGAVVSRLVQEAADGGHDLMVVGAKPQSSFQRRVVGNTGQGLLKHAPCPVWVARAPEPLEAVLVAHDLGPVGDAAYRRAAAIAESLQLPLHVLHVQATPEASPTDARKHLKQLAMGGEVTEAKVVVLERSSVEQSILEHIQQHAIGLLVLGTVGRRGLRRRVWGTTAEHLLAQTNISVLAVTPTEMDEIAEEPPVVIS